MRFMSEVRAAEKFAESGRFAFHTTNDREGVGNRLAAFGNELGKGDLFQQSFGQRIEKER